MRGETNKRTSPCKSFSDDRKLYSDVLVCKNTNKSKLAQRVKDFVNKWPSSKDLCYYLSLSKVPISTNSYDLRPIIFASLLDSQLNQPVVNGDLFSRICLDNNNMSTLFTNEIFLESLSEVLNDIPNDKLENNIDKVLLLYQLIIILMCVLQNMSSTSIKKFGSIFEFAESLISTMPEELQNDFEIRVNALKYTSQRLVNLNKDLDYFEDNVAFRVKPVLPLTLDALYETTNSCFDSGEDLYKNREEYLHFLFVAMQCAVFIPFVKSLKKYFQKRLLPGHSTLLEEPVIFFMNVKFLGFRLVKYKICFVTNITADTLTSKVNFKEGSLLIFSKNEFQSFMFAIVVKDEGKFEMTKNLVVVYLLNETFDKIGLTCNFTVAVSDIVYEPFENLLSGLQNIDTDLLPISYYFDYKSLKAGKPQYALGSDVQYRKWSSFDFSQNVVYHFCLSHSVSIIQGPPGTGKTFVIIGIINSLLEKSSLWYNFENPIVILTRTRSALDCIFETLCQSRPLEYIAPFNDIETEIENVHDMISRNTVNDDLALSSYNLKLTCLDLEVLLNQEGIVSYSTYKHFNIWTEDQQKYFESCSSSYTGNAVYYRWILNVPSSEQSLSCDYEKHFNSESFSLSSRFESNGVRDASIDENGISTRITFVETTENLQARILDLRERIVKYYTKYVKVSIKHDNYIEDLLKRFENIKQYISTIRYETSCNRNDDLQIAATLLNSKDLSKLSREERWILYRNCKRRLLSELWKMFYQESKTLLEYADQYNSIIHARKMTLLRKRKIIGMTINEALQNQALLHGLESKIVIVEEADEISEAGLLVTLGKSCQQLILTGSHQDSSLPCCPSKCVPATGKSFYGRLLERYNPIVLNKQHRLPEKVSGILQYVLGPKAYACSSLKQDTDVPGVKQSFGFFNHTNTEDEIKVGEFASYSNQFESSFIVNFLKYLAFINHDTSKIAVVSPFEAQVNSIKEKVIPYRNLQNAIVTTVDEFSGRESSIVIVSLVRKNDNGDIGRDLRNACFVAKLLSRATEGLYIFGNIETLSKCSRVWKNIHIKLKESQSIFNSLTLVCSDHREELNVKSAKCFYKAFNCGCYLTKSVEYTV